MSSRLDQVSHFHLTEASQEPYAFSQTHHILSILYGGASDQAQALIVRLPWGESDRVWAIREISLLWCYLV